MKKLNFNDFITLCKKNYNKGGDAFVECYTEDIYYECFPNGLTQNEALQQIRYSYEQEKDEAGYIW